jgi:hypothetical protein
MYVDRKPLAGVEQFHQHARVTGLAVGPAQPFVRIRADRITEQRAVGKSRGSEVRLTEASDGGGHPLLR